MLRSKILGTDPARMSSVPGKIRGEPDAQDGEIYGCTATARCSITQRAAVN